MTQPVFTMLIAGRDVALKAPTDGQLAAAMKILDNARRDVAVQERKPEEDREYGHIITSTGKLLRIIDMLIDKEEDREFLEDQMISGEIGLLELVDVLKIFGMEQAEAAPKAGPKPKARRAK